MKESSASGWKKLILSVAKAGMIDKSIKELPIQQVGSPLLLGRVVEEKPESE